MFRDEDGPGLGLWYDFRRRLPTGDHAAFYTERLEEIEEGDRPGFTGARLSEHHFLDDGYPPSPPVVAARPRTMTIGANVLLPMRQWGAGGGKPRPGLREEDRPREVVKSPVELHGEDPYYHSCFRGRLPGVTHEGALENPRPFATEVVRRVRDAGESEPA